MKENEQELFPLMPQAVKDSLACSLRQAQAILAARELSAKYGEET